MNEKATNQGSDAVRGSAWWRTPVGLTQLTGVLSIVGAVLTTGHTWATDWLQSQRDERERARAADQQESTFYRELEKNYFERAIAVDTSADSQARVLRYLRDSNNVRPEMQEWARDELDLLQAQADERERKSAAEAKKAEEQAKIAAAALLALPQNAPTETRRKLEAEQQEARVRAESLAGIAAARTREAERVAEQSKEIKARQCTAGSVQAVQLGTDDPAQEVADAYCISSAANKRFGESSSEVTWTTRYGGRNYRCFCKL